MAKAGKTTSAAAASGGTTTGEGEPFEGERPEAGATTSDASTDTASPRSESEQSDAGAVETQSKPDSTSSLLEPERRGVKLLVNVIRNKQRHEIGSTLEVTYSEFRALQRAGVVRDDEDDD